MQNVSIYYICRVIKNRYIMSAYGYNVRQWNLLKQLSKEESCTVNIPLSKYEDMERKVSMLNMIERDRNYTTQWSIYEPEGTSYVVQTSDKSVDLLAKKTEKYANMCIDLQSKLEETNRKNKSQKTYLKYNIALFIINVIVLLTQLYIL